MHDSSAAAFDDYEMVAAVSEERLTRVKGSGESVPWLSIDEVLKATPEIATFTRRTGTELGPAVADYYRAVDVVALGSTWEAFGKVMVEAMSHGLPCVAHDGPVQRWLLESQGSLGDLTKEGELARLISPFCTDPRDEKAMCQRHRAAYERFSWDTLTPRYAEVFLRWCEPVRRRDESR